MQEEFIPEDFAIPVIFHYSAFFDLLADAAFQHRCAKDQTDSYIMSRYSRASVIASALSVECAANCLLGSLDISNSLRSELDKITPVAKIETYMRLQSINEFDRGRPEVQRVVELIKARNDYVHPKVSSIPATTSLPLDGGADWIIPFSLQGEHWKELGIPKKSMFWSSSSSLAALGTVASFFTYVFKTLLKASEEELQRILPSRIEMGDKLVFLAVFEEIKSELRGAADHGIDFSLFEFLSGTSFKAK